MASEPTTSRASIQQDQRSILLPRDCQIPIWFEPAAEKEHHPTTTPQERIVILDSVATNKPSQLKQPELQPQTSRKSNHDHNQGRRTTLDQQSHSSSDDHSYRAPKQQKRSSGWEGTGEKAAREPNKGTYTQASHYPTSSYSQTSHYQSTTSNKDRYQGGYKYKDSNYRSYDHRHYEHSPYNRSSARSPEIVTIKKRSKIVKKVSRNIGKLRANTKRTSVRTTAAVGITPNRETNKAAKDI